MELNKRESEYLVKYLKEVQGTFQANEYTWVDPNDEHYTNITAAYALLLNDGLSITFNFESEYWNKDYTIIVPLIDFIIFCSQQKEESK